MSINREDGGEKGAKSLRKKGGQKSLPLHRGTKSGRDVGEKAGVEKNQRVESCGTGRVTGRAVEEKGTRNKSKAAEAC